jgi:hypothetical protein
MGRKAETAEDEPGLARVVALDAGHAFTFRTMSMKAN